MNLDVFSGFFETILRLNSLTENSTFRGELVSKV
jgi:hypothetical protein